MKNLVIAFVFFTFCTPAFSQQPEWNQEAFLGIYNIGPLKSEYERYRYYASRSPSNSSAAAKRDAFYEEYTTWVQRVKGDPTLYLSFLDAAIEHKLKPDSSVYGNGVYLRFHPSMAIGGLPYDENEYYLPYPDYYRFVRYVLFERGDDLLPEDFKPVMEYLDQRQ